MIRSLYYIAKGILYWKIYNTLHYSDPRSYMGYNGSPICGTPAKKLQNLGFAAHKHINSAFAVSIKLIKITLALVSQFIVNQWKPMKTYCYNLTKISNLPQFLFHFSQCIFSSGCWDSHLDSCRNWCLWYFM